MSGTRPSSWDLPPWVPTASVSRWSVDRSARIIGHYTWIESTLFTMVGSWAEQTEQVELRHELAAHSERHAWRAEQWQHRLPTFADYRPDTLVTPPGPGVAEAFTAVARAAEPSRLTGLYRVLLPRLIAVYTEHRHGCAPHADAATIIRLDRCLADAQQQAQTGELLTQFVLRTAQDIADAAAFRTQLELQLFNAEAWLAEE